MSSTHNSKVLSFQLLGTCNTALSVSSAYKESIQAHNELVEKNIDMSCQQ